MAIRFRPLPLDVFTDEQRPYIAHMNTVLRELTALEGIIRNPRTTKRRSDATVARQTGVQVDISRITPSISQVVSGVSTAIGKPALVLGMTNVVGSTTTAVSINSQVAVFDGTAASAIGSSAATGSAAFAARRDHQHIYPPALGSTANFSLLTLTDDGTNQTLTGNLGGLTIDAMGSIVLDSGTSVPTAFDAVMAVNIRPGSGQLTGIISNPVVSSLVSQTLNMWQARFGSYGAGMTASTLIGFRGIGSNLTCSAGSDNTNKYYGFREERHTLLVSAGGWNEAAAAYLSGPGPAALATPSVAAAYMIKGEMPTCGVTDQIGIDLQDGGSTTKNTPLNRWGIRVQDLLRGSTRTAFWGSNRFFCDASDFIANASGKGIVIKASDDTTRFLRVRALYNGGAPTLTIDDVGTSPSAT